MEILEHGQEKHLITEKEREELNTLLAHQGFYNAALDQYEITEHKDEHWIGEVE